MISIKKISTPKPARIFYSELLENKMLKTTDIDIMDIYQDYHGFSRQVMKSITDGETQYLKPGTLKIISAYKKPFTMQTVRSTMFWNAMYPKEYISESTSFKILELDPTIVPPIAFESKTGEKDKDGQAITELVDNPAFPEFLLDHFGQDHHDRIMKLLSQQPMLKKYGMYQVAIPLDWGTVPPNLANLAYVSHITSSVISKGNILLEALGFVVVKSRNTQVVSNVIRI